jgi:serine/threonine-protein kinase
MKRCPACRRVYDRDAKFCQIDGTILADFNSDPLIGRMIAKRYRLVRRLGHGPLGAVYLAAELATGRSVAVKILVSELQCDDDVLKQCLWDARFATASRPSHIVRVYEVDRTDDGRVFIAMEYLEGETLSDLIQREGALELGRALTLASQIARGVAAASRAGVSHRDLKPQNVMVMSPDERVKVTDFGVAWLRRGAHSGTLTRLGEGATKYMAPEQWVGADADDRTDVYGIGAVLYAMLAGPAPSIARTRVVAGSDIRWEAPPPIRTARPDIPVSLEHFLARAMEREPERRHNGIEAFAEDLFNLTASIIETQTKEAGAREAPYAERGQAYREQWRARWPGYRARWQAERDRWQVWSRAQMSGATVAVARVANSAAHAIAGKATGAAAGASRMVAGVTRTVGHGLAAVSRKAAGAATGASRVVATAAGTVAGAVGARHERCRSQ